MSPPSLADIDGDHKVEIVLSLKDVLGGKAGGVQIWDIASSTDNCLPWPTGRGNNLRNGQCSKNQSSSASIRPKYRQMEHFKSSTIVEIYNLKGQLIASRKIQPGHQALHQKIGPGLYLYKTVEDNYRNAKLMIADK